MMKSVLMYNVLSIPIFQDFLYGRVVGIYVR